jgi:hypothetical protein
LTDDLGVVITAPGIPMFSLQAAYTGAFPSAGASATVTWAAVTGALEYNIYREINGIYAYIGTAAGLGVFTQMFLGAVTAQIYGMVATTSVVPLVVVMMTTSALVLACGMVPTWLSHRSR